MDTFLELTCGFKEGEGIHVTVSDAEEDLAIMQEDSPLWMAFDPEFRRFRRCLALAWPCPDVEPPEVLLRPLQRDVGKVTFCWVVRDHQGCLVTEGVHFVASLPDDTIIPDKLFTQLQRGHPEYVQDLLNREERRQYPNYDTAFLSPAACVLNGWWHVLQRPGWQQTFRDRLTDAGLISPCQVPEAPEAPKTPDAAPMSLAGQPPPPWPESPLIVVCGPAVSPPPAEAGQAGQAAVGLDEVVVQQLKDDRLTVKQIKRELKAREICFRHAMPKAVLKTRLLNALVRGPTVATASPCAAGIQTLTAADDADDADDADAGGYEADEAALTPVTSDALSRKRRVPETVPAAGFTISATLANLSALDTPSVRLLLAQTFEDMEQSVDKLAERMAHQ